MLVQYSLIALILFSQLGCRFPLNKEELLAAKQIDLTKDEAAFVCFRQVFAEKARGQHLSLINSTQPHWPPHLKKIEGTLRSLIDLAANMQREASTSELRDLLQGDREWLARAFVRLLRKHKPDRDYDSEYNQWQKNLDLTFTCFADINISNERSLNDLSLDAINCLNLIPDDSHRLIFVALGGFLLDDAYTLGIIDRTLE